MLTRNRIFGMMAGGALAVAMSAAPAVANASTAEAAPQAAKCTPATLQLSLGTPHGAAGSVNQALRFTNVGNAACSMVGFPGVSYVNGDVGNQVGAPAHRSGPSGSVVLQPGATAHSNVKYVRVQNYPDSTCKPTHVRGIRVYPPNNTAAMYVPRPGKGCANPNVSQLDVRSVQPGPGQ